MLNRDTIAKMRDGAILINNSRGQLMDELDVSDALKSGKLAAAGLDAVSTEPIRADNFLLTATNCIITPPYVLGCRGGPPADQEHHRGQCESFCLQCSHQCRQ